MLCVLINIVFQHYLLSDLITILIGIGQFILYSFNYHIFTLLKKKNNRYLEFFSIISTKFNLYWVHDYN